MTNAEARFNKSLRPRKPEGSLGQTAQDGHLDSHTAPELSEVHLKRCLGQRFIKRWCFSIWGLLKEGWFLVGGSLKGVVWVRGSLKGGVF